MNATAACPLARHHPAVPGATPPVSWAEMVSHRSYLVRYAQRKLRDPALAEDAVHDVFEAVLSGRAAFAGRAALRSWLTAVLKHKIVDTVRRHARFEALDDAVDDEGALAIECPQPGPDRIAEQRELLARTLERIETLPDGLRDALRMRVLDEQPTAAVCAALGISEDNLFVRMHRARRQLLS
ncbi:MAG: sigma-70 family RNA polymerase sigma factor [Caldimonas sp.]